MKFLTLLLTGFLAISMSTDTADSIYQFNMKNIDGEEVSLEQYEGKVVLIVNTASECGYTPQYEGLQKIYDEYKEDGLVVLGFPANNFNGQEPGTNKEIKKFCTTKFNVQFPMFSKISVKGEDQAELFEFLTTQPNPDFEGEIKWNFEKFLVDRNGNLQRRFRSSVEPQSEELLSAVQKELSKKAE